MSDFEAAVKRGDITWHAGPMNMQIENMDQSLLEFGITISNDLDKRFNITRKFKTLSQRDVPGMNRYCSSSEFLCMKFSLFIYCKSISLHKIFTVYILQVYISA